MLAAVPTMAIMIDLMDLWRVAVTHAVQCRHACIGADGIAWIDLLDLRYLGKDFELNDSFDHRAGGTRCNVARCAAR